MSNRRLQLQVDEQNKQKCCTYKNLCGERAQWWFNLGVALMVLGGLLGLAGIVVAAVFAGRSLDATSQQRYGVSHTMFTYPLNHVLTGSTPITLTLPNDLSPYVGAQYTVDCETAAAHEVVITAGALPTFWEGGGGMQRTVTCTGGAAARSGFSFRVVSASHVRITQQSHITLSA